jgi:hypothetical protein
MRAKLFLPLASVAMLAVAPQQIRPQPLPDGYLSPGYNPNGSAIGMKVEELGPAARTFKLSFRKGDELMMASWSSTTMPNALLQITAC